jgi:L-histidine Nalpha-methyltransferase
MGSTSLANVLQNVLGGQARPNPWSLCLVADDAERKLQDLIADLTRPASTTGDGKRITSGFAYWGSEPTFAWARSCTDPLYPVARESIESFTSGWAEFQPYLDGQAYHYVSFGPGTGEKDAAIVGDLMRCNPNLYYIPVDMSPEMLRLAVRGRVRQTGLPADRVLPVQLDFASQTSLAALWTLLEHVTGTDPVLYSLLGNTLANFDNDVEMLRALTARARPDDRFVLEAATSDRLDERTAVAAALEYRQSRSFCEFATSALLRHTDLRIDDMEQLAFVGSVEAEKALRVTAMYQNVSGLPTRLTLLPNRMSVLLRAGDTIRLYLTRKYVATGLKSMLADCGLIELASTHSYFVADVAPPQFGMSLMLVFAGGSDPNRPASSADDIWG